LVLLSVCLLLLLTSVVVIGTLYVPLSTLIVGRMVQIGPAFYNNVLMPIGILLLAATAIVPLARWGSAMRRGEVAALLVCAVVACGAVSAAAYVGVRHPVALAVTGLAVLTACTTTAGLWRDIRRHGAERYPLDIFLVLRKHRRQYAGYIIHLAIASLAIGITGSSLGTRRQEAELKEGDTIEWAGRQIEYLKLVQREEGERLIAEVELRVSTSGYAPVVLKPARHFHTLQDLWTTEVAIHSTWSADFYTILNAGLGDGRVVLTLVENPMMRWIWCGGWLAAGGAIVAAWPARKERTRQGGQLGNVRQTRLLAPAGKRRAA